MIHIIDNHLAPGSQPLLQSMFADRKRLFVDLFGWDVPVIDGQYEIDQFDNAHTIYLIAADDDGQHEASLRDRKSVVSGKSETVRVYLGGRGIFKKKNKKDYKTKNIS